MLLASSLKCNWNLLPCFFRLSRWNVISGHEVEKYCFQILWVPTVLKIVSMIPWSWGICHYKNLDKLTCQKEKVSLLKSSCFFFLYIMLSKWDGSAVSFSQRFSFLLVFRIHGNLLEIYAPTALWPSGTNLRIF